MNWSTLFFSTLSALCSVTAAQAQALTGAQCLRRAYPDVWATPTPEHMAGNLLNTHTGQLFAFDEHKDHLPHAALLNQADLTAQMAQPYPVGFPVAIPARNQDPGRMRSEPFSKLCTAAHKKKSGATLLLYRGRLQAVRCFSTVSTVPHRHWNV